MTLVQQWKNEGKRKGKLEVAQRLLEIGMEVESVAKPTGLPLKIIEELKVNSTHME